MLFYEGGIADRHEFSKSRSVVMYPLPCNTYVMLSEPTSTPIQRNKRTVEDLYSHVNTMLGGTSIETHLEQDDFDAALDEALHQYRAHSVNSVKFGWYSLYLEPGKQLYRLPHFVDEVRRLARLRGGVLGTAGYEPFSAAYVQQVLTPLTGSGGGTGGDIATYEALADYQELLGRMFGEFITYSFERNRKDLLIDRLPRSPEVIGVEVSVTRPIEDLINDATSYRWLRSYTEACCRTILGEKLSRFAALPGPQGATSLNGDKLSTQGSDMKKDLMEQLLNWEDGGEPAMPFWG